MREGWESLGTAKGPDRIPSHLYSQEARADRLIALARVLLASFSLWAVWVEPTHPVGYGPLMQGLMALYVVYSLTTLAIVGRAPAPLRHPVFAHLLDLVILSVLFVVTSGASSAIFPFFTFSLAAATLRRQRRGTLWTAVATIAVVAGGGLYTAAGPPQAFKLNEFIIRLVALAVAAVLLGKLGAYEAGVRRVLHNLANEPEVGTDNLDTLVRDLARWAADVLNAPRALIAWEEADEPWLYLVWWQGEARYAQEPPGVRDLVAEDMASADFLCHGAGGRQEPVLHTSPEGFKRWRGEPLHPSLRHRFSVGSVLSARFEVEGASGRLFLFEKPKMTSDDILLGGIVARRIGARLNQVYLLRRLSERAALKEGVKVAGDLHDGALHALAGVALELEGLLRMPKSELAEAHDRMREIQDSLVAEQRTLRMLIGRLRTSRSGVVDPGFTLSASLRDLVERLERQWNLKVEWSESDLDALPTRWASEVYLLVHEALLNAARHAGASLVKLDVTIKDGCVTIVIADDGHGFGFKGRYDQATLAALRLGPATLRERATLLGGNLTLDSTERGTRLEISFPLEPSPR